MTIYYKIIDKNLIGKSEDGRKFLYLNGVWEIDQEHIIMDRLMGYDSDEPKGSPYTIGNLSIMEKIEEITEAEALKFLCKQSF